MKKSVNMRWKMEEKINFRLERYLHYTNIKIDVQNFEKFISSSKY